MREGWLEDEYLIVFEESEAGAIADGYGITVALPGFELIGLRGWDDFLVRDESRKIFSVPSIPLDKNYLRVVKKLDRRRTRSWYDVASLPKRVSSHNR